MDIEKNIDKTYEGITILIDNTEFEDCTFKKCVLKYSGSGPVSFNGCEFIDTKWGFEGAAQNTIEFLRAAYHGMGEGGKKLIEGIFNRIRSEKIDLPSDIGEYKRRIMTYDNYVVIEYSKRPIFRPANPNATEKLIEENLLTDVKEYSYEQAVQSMRKKIHDLLQEGIISKSDFTNTNEGNTN